MSYTTDKLEEYIKELEQKLEAVRYLWSTIDLNEGDYILPDDAAVMSQIDEVLKQ